MNELMNNLLEGEGVRSILTERRSSDDTLTKFLDNRKVERILDNTIERLEDLKKASKKAKVDGGSSGKIDLSMADLKGKAQAISDIAVQDLTELREMLR